MSVYEYVDTRGGWLLNADDDEEEEEVVEFQTLKDENKKLKDENTKLKIIMKRISLLVAEQELDALKQ
tara:strand:+ start:1010 stop:1213 length:204 start_codon:yes stop_codon:yes gene_type:complete